MKRACGEEGWYAQYRIGSAGIAGLLEPLEPRRLLSAAAKTTMVDPVLEWNQVFIDAARADRTYPGPGWASRNAAILHAAIYDAVDAIDRSYEPYLVHVKAPRGTPLTAAVAAAGWRVLSSLYPQQA